MTVVPNPKTWVDNEVVSPQDLNTEIRDALNFILNKPAFKGGPIEQPLTANDTWTRVNFDNIYIDNTAIFDPATPDQVSVSVPGVYNVSVKAEFAAGTNGNRSVRVMMNGIQTVRAVGGASPDSTSSVGTTSLLYLTPDDVLSLDVRESGDGDTLLAGEQATYLTLTWQARDL